MSPLTLILARTLTLNPEQPDVQAVLVGGGRVLACGTREDLLRGLETLRQLA